MLLSILLAAVAVISSSCIHLSVMRWVSVNMAKIPLEPFNRVMLAVLILFMAHFVGILLFAATFGIGHQLLNIGGFSGSGVDTVLDYFYFSVVSYTSLGLGDIFPTGHLRLLTGVEALIGLLLIAWSGAYLFAMMNRLWDWPACAEPDDPNQPRNPADSPQPEEMRRQTDNDVTQG